MEVSIKAEGKKSKAPDKWEIQSWANTLMEAEEIKADPEKMKHVKPYLKKKVAAIRSLEDLREVADGKKAIRRGDAEEDESDTD